jgi:hypothetical protein
MLGESLNQDAVDDLFRDAAPQTRVDCGRFALVGDVPGYLRNVTAVRLERETPLVPKARPGDWLCVSDTGAFGIIGPDELAERYRRLDD